MVDWSFLFELTKTLVEVGKKYKEKPPLNEVEPFKHYFSSTGDLNYESLDEFDGVFTRREIIARYLLLNVVLDQGPDIKGVRELLKNVTSNLYRQGIRIFHEPFEFFRNINTVIDEIVKEHERIEKEKSS